MFNIICTSIFSHSNWFPINYWTKWSIQKIEMFYTSTRYRCLKRYIYLLMKYDRLDILVNVQVVRRYLMRVSLDVFELIIPRDRIFVVLWKDYIFTKKKRNVLPKITFT
jgi:hypothetical protein